MGQVIAMDAVYDVAMNFCSFAVISIQNFPCFELFNRFFLQRGSCRIGATSKVCGQRTAEAERKVYQPRFYFAEMIDADKN